MSSRLVPTRYFPMDTRNWPSSSQYSSLFDYYCPVDSDSDPEDPGPPPPPARRINLDRLYSSITRCYLCNAICTTHSPSASALCFFCAPNVGPSFVDISQDQDSDSGTETEYVEPGINEPPKAKRARRSAIQITLDEASQIKFK